MVSKRSREKAGSENHGGFRLLDLPLELRMRVYSFALESKILISRRIGRESVPRTSKLHGIFLRLKPHDHFPDHCNTCRIRKDLGDTLPTHPSFNLALTSKQVRNEVIHQMVLDKRDDAAFLIPDCNPSLSSFSHVQEFIACLTHEEQEIFIARGLRIKICEQCSPHLGLSIAEVLPYFKHITFEMPFRVIEEPPKGERLYGDLVQTAPLSVFDSETSRWQMCFTLQEYDIRVAAAVSNVRTKVLRQLLNRRSIGEVLGNDKYLDLEADKAGKKPDDVWDCNINSIAIAERLGEKGTAEKIMQLEVLARKVREVRPEERIRLEEWQKCASL
ncbi:MAG: hypothetical protein Q9157_004026 [Trypethelium eluteriae]